MDDLDLTLSNMDALRFSHPSGHEPHCESCLVKRVAQLGRYGDGSHFLVSSCPGCGAFSLRALPSPSVRRRAAQRSSP